MKKPKSEAQPEPTGDPLIDGIPMSLTVEGRRYLFNTKRMSSDFVHGTPESRTEMLMLWGSVLASARQEQMILEIERRSMFSNAALAALKKDSKASSWKIRAVIEADENYQALMHRQALNVHARTLLASLLSALSPGSAPKSDGEAAQGHDEAEL